MSDVQAPAAATKSVPALLCIRCRDYLTVLPFMTSNEGSICGRCYRPEEFTNETRPYRNFPFEAIFVLYPFPCKYRSHGCTERGKGDARLIHEESCLHRPIRCFVRNCEWNDIVANLQSHVEQTHPALFLQSGCVHINTDADYEISTLILDKHLLYILQTKFVKLSSKLWLSVVHVRTTQYHKINSIELEFKSDRKYIFFKTAFTDELKPISTETALELDVLSLKSLLGHPAQLTASIKLLMQHGKELMDVDILNHLECCVCTDYMVAPIFLCANGHSICRYCNGRVRACPTCRAPRRNVHNYVLEAIVKLMYYPCKFNINSCRYIGPSIKIRKHEKNCIFKI